jgi:DNA polymerase-3 subunit beta
MRLTIERSALLKALNHVQSVVERRNTIPILSNVLIETAGGGGIEMAATDLDVGLRCRLPAEVRKPGALTLSAKKLFEIVRAVDDRSIELKELENSWASITSGKAYFKMVGLSKTEFPSLAEPPAAGFTAIAGSTLSDLIHKTSFAITADDSRYFLNGARLELTDADMRMVATDGHRLAFISLPRPSSSSGNLSAIVPKKTLLELLKILGEGQNEVSFAKGDNHLFFRIGDRLLVSKRVDDQFPAYDKVIPQGNDKKVTCATAELVGALRRVSLLANERSRAVKFGIDSGRIEISSQNPELGEARETIEATYQGPSLQVGFNGQYLLDFLNVTGSSEVTFELKDDSSQGLLRPAAAEDGADYRYVVMPMRL